MSTSKALLWGKPRSRVERAEGAVQGEERGSEVRMWKEEGKMKENKTEKREKRKRVRDKKKIIIAKRLLRKCLLRKHFHLWLL